MGNRPLSCTMCGAPASVVEDTYGHIDWGPAVIGDDGVVRPGHTNPREAHQTVVDNAGITRIRACCSNEACGHQWTLRRRFDPLVTP